MRLLGCMKETSPQSLDISTLPSIALKHKAKLPNIGGIYFVLDKFGQVQYIGKSFGIKQRWQQHHLYRQIKHEEGMRIAYLAVDSPELLPEIEVALISWFKPQLNKQILKYGEVKQRYQIMLTPTASSEIDRVSGNLEITRSELVEKVIRQGLLEKVVMNDAESA